MEAGTDMNVITTDARLVYRRIVEWWAVVSLPAAFTVVLFENYFFIYGTDVLLIAPAAIGTLLAVSRIYDGISDLALATWSDRTKSRFGRRRPFVIAGGLMALGYGAFWLPPEQFGPAATIMWVGIMLILFETAMTLVHVPTQALGIEAGQTPQRRTFYRTLGLVLGLPLAIVANFVMQHLIDSPDARAAGAPWFVGAGVVFAMFSVGMGLRLKELPVEHRSVERNFVKMMREVLSVGYHRRLLGVQLVETLAFTSMAFSTPYVMTYIIEEPGRMVWMFMAYIVVAHVSQLGWITLIPRWGMKRIWLIGLAIWAFVYLLFPLVFWFGSTAYLFMALFGGLASGASAVNYAMLGDIADYDARQSGRQRQGIYITIYRLIAKLGGAAVAFSLGWTLQLSGFVPNAEQGSATIAAIFASACVIPLIGVLGGMRLLSGYEFYRNEGISDGRREFLEQVRLDLEKPADA